MFFFSLTWIKLYLVWLKRVRDQLCVLANTDLISDVCQCLIRLPTHFTRGKRMILIPDPSLSAKIIFGSLSTLSLYSRISFLPLPPHTPLYVFHQRLWQWNLSRASYWILWTRLPLLNFYVIDCVQWNWATTNTLTWGFHKPTSSLMRVWYVVPNTDRHCLPERLIFK